jgi:hypothetical protein
MKTTRLSIYEVKARGIHGNIFIYHVGAPEGTPEVEIACLAYAEHGKDLKAGTVRTATGQHAPNEYLGPDHTVTLISTHEYPVTCNG